MDLNTSLKRELLEQKICIIIPKEPKPNALVRFSPV